MKSVLVRLNEYQLQMTPAESEVVHTASPREGGGAVGS